MAARSGAQSLALLSSPLNLEILRTLSQAPTEQVVLRRECGLPAQSTLRAQLRKLDAEGAVDKRRRDGFPGAIEYHLTEAGEELLKVAETLERWLRTSPNGPLEPGSSAAKASIKALAEGWSSRMLRSLAAEPLTLTELDGAIASLNYPSLERRLGAMRLSGQVEALPAEGRGTPYAVTDWSRKAMAPIVAAARWERLYRPEQTPPIAHEDAEAAFLLVLPLLCLDDDLTGMCQLLADIRKGSKKVPAGVVAEARGGRIAFCAIGLEEEADAGVSGPPPAWLAAVIDGDIGELEASGDRRLARALLNGLHEALFAGAGATSA